MFWKHSVLLLGLAMTAATLGCSSPVDEEVIVVEASNDPLSEPRSILNRYAEGQPMGSESTGFPRLVENVRETDPQRAAILEEGLAELQQSSPSERPAKAKQLLEKLQPSMQ